MAAKSYTAHLLASHPAQYVVANAAPLAAWTAIGSAALQALNRSALNLAPVVDGMTLSGISTLGAAACFLFARKYPGLRRVAGCLGVAHAALLAYDAWGKPGDLPLAVSLAASTGVGLSLVFERSKKRHLEANAHMKKEKPTHIFNRAAMGFRKSPLLWTGMFSAVTKLAGLPFATANREFLFIGSVVAGSLASALLALSDNSIQLAFKAGAAARPPQEPRPRPAPRP